MNFELVYFQASSALLCYVPWSSNPDYSLEGTQTTADNNYLFMLETGNYFPATIPWRKVLLSLE